MNKKIIFIIVIVGLVILILYQGFFKEEKLEYDLFQVSRGDVFQEVSETGQVQSGEEIGLSFKSAGTIEAIYVKVGAEVWPGTALAKIETTELHIELNEAQAALEIAQAKLDQLLEGSTPEAIQAARTDVENAQVALDDTEREYEEDLNHAYEDASNALDGAYLKSSSALATIISIRKSYFTGGDQESLTVKAKESHIDDLVAEIKGSIDNDDVDTALSVTENALDDIYDALNIIREMTEVANYTGIVSAADKTLLNTERTNINTALTNIINSQQTIATTKIDGQIDINTAEGDLQEAQDDLALQLAGPSQANIALYQAQVRQAQAKVDLLDNKIRETTLKSPVRGQVTRINKEIGETVQPAIVGSVVTILPANPYEIEVEIYEEDIVKMVIGNDVEISLIAFPNEVFPGKVISINPAEELIEGVVYYTVIVSFAEIPQGIRPGMTADLVIRTDSRIDVLMIPEDAIEERDDKNIVQVFKDNQIEEREIEIGLVGSDDMIEVIAGLTEEEKVVVE